MRRKTAIAKSVKKISLEIKLGKKKLKNPIVYASGSFGYGVEFKDIVDFDFVGAFVTKTVTLHPKKGNQPPRIIELDCGVLNSIGLENPGLDTFLKEKLPLIKKINTPFIVSIAGSNLGEFVEIIKKLNKIKDIFAIELNLSCPNIKGKIISQNEKLTYKIVKAIREKTEKTLIVKLTPQVKDITKVAKKAYEAGADILSLVNTYLGIAVDIENQKFFLGEKFGGYSGKAIKPLALYCVYKVAQSLKIPIIGGGGISTWQDALEFFLVGAHYISIGTAVLSNPNIAKEITLGITSYLEKKGIKDIKEIIGKLLYV